MSGKCETTTPTGTDCTAGGNNCEHDATNSKCKCADGYIDSPTGCTVQLSKCSERCKTGSSCDSS